MKEQPITPAQKTLDSNTGRQVPRRSIESTPKAGRVPLRKDGQPMTRKQVP